MKTIFIIITLIGGKPVSPPITVETLYDNCNTEFAMVYGINKHLKDIESPLRYKAVCVTSLED